MYVRTTIIAASVFFFLFFFSGSEVQSLPPAPSSLGLIVAVVVVILVVLILIVVVIVIIAILYSRNKRLSKKGIYSPRHFAEQANVRSDRDTLELKYASSPHTPGDDPFSASAAEKAAEAHFEAPEAPVVPPTVTPTEGECCKAML